jgi:hypothetical protein
MRSFHNSTFALCLIPLFTVCGSQPPADQPTVPRWGVIEFDLQYDGSVENPFVDVSAEAVFRPNGGAPILVDGFYDGDNVWRFRFAPSEHGNWKADLKLLRDGSTVATGSQQFVCVGDHQHGFLRRSERNPYRLEYDDGVPFYSVGIQPCGAAAAGLDGARGRGPWRSLPMEEYLGEFAGAANLFRIQLGAGTRKGCAREVMTDSLGLYRYELEACRLLDHTYELLDRFGFASLLIPFQDMSLWGDDTTVFGGNKVADGWKDIENVEAIKPVKHYLRYLVARYAAYTDIWEFFNEDVYTPDAWLAGMAAYVRELDPYDHLTTTNYERTQADWNDIITAHMYMSTPAWETDLLLTKEYARMKSFGKPVMYTEFGNKGNYSNRDPVKWRIAVWTAFMNESSMLFWSMGGRITIPRKDVSGGNANAYLGKEARSSFRHFLDFTRDLPIDMRPVMVGHPGRHELNKYALSNGETTVLYITHFTNHSKPAQGGIYLWTGPGKFRIEWLNTESGETFKTENAETISNTITFQTPDITTDMAAKITRIG